MHERADTTVGELVAADFRISAVFNALGINFCCDGRRTVAEACRQRCLDTDVVMQAIEQACAQPGSSPHFDRWKPETLIGFIVVSHHGYVRRVIPSLLANVRKVAAVHGGCHPELHEVAQLTETLALDMLSHMATEERILFPYIADVATDARHGRPARPAPFGSIENPLRVMEEEHQSAGACMTRIRELTGGFALPEDGCATYRVCLAELRAFEEDLHAHVHLENNVLFRKARALAAAPPLRAS